MATVPRTVIPDAGQLRRVARQLIPADTLVAGDPLALRWRFCRRRRRFRGRLASRLSARLWRCRPVVGPRPRARGPCPWKSA